MRRQTLNPSNFNNLMHTHLKRRKSNPEAVQQLLSQANSNTHLKGHFFQHPLTIVSSVINDTLMSSFQKQLEKIQFKKLVDQTMVECTNLFNHENWQINPVGPENHEKGLEHTLKPDEEPISKNFDPKLGFDKERFTKLSTIKQCKDQRVKTQSSISSSRFRNSKNLIKQKPLSSLRPSQLNNVTSGQSLSSISGLQPSSRKNSDQRNSKLIPLKFQQLTPESQLNPSRRNLQDFLRNQKINANGGQRIKTIFDEKDINLKTIQEFEKSTMLIKTTRAFGGQGLGGQAGLLQLRPLPLFSSREQYTTDYTGEPIVLRKSFKPLKPTQILKSVYKVLRSQTESNLLKTQKTPKHIPSKLPLIKLKPLGPHKKEEDNENLINSINFSQRRLTEGSNLKEQLQHKMMTNRVRFKELRENEGFALGLMSDKQRGSKQKNILQNEHKKGSNDEKQINQNELVAAMKRKAKLSRLSFIGKRQIQILKQLKPVESKFKADNRENDV